YAREPKLRQAFLAGDWFRCLEEKVSDSASLDNAMELLLRQGRSPEAALLALVPPAYEGDQRFKQEIHRYLEATAPEIEPWDGPAALVFSDGRIVGAKLDRNGLRPLRYAFTSDGWMIAGSEAGIAEFAGDRIVERQRLGPGEMLMVNIAEGSIVRNGEI